MVLVAVCAHVLAVSVASHLIVGSWKYTVWFRLVLDLVVCTSVSVWTHVLVSVIIIPVAVRPIKLATPAGSGKTYKGEADDAETASATTHVHTTHVQVTTLTRTGPQSPIPRPCPAARAAR